MTAQSGLSVYMLSRAGKILCPCTPEYTHVWVYLVLIMSCCILLLNINMIVIRLGTVTVAVAGSFTKEGGGVSFLIFHVL